MLTLTLTVKDITGNSLDEITANALEVGRRFFGEGPALKAEIVGSVTTDPSTVLYTEDEFLAKCVDVTAVV
jgi:hypothetical protein